MKKRMFVMILLVLAVVAIIAFFKYRDIKSQMAAGAAMATIPFVVSTMPATETDWSEHKQAVGTIRAEKGVDITSEVAGIVEKIEFNSGQDIKEGDLLIKLRSADDEARLQTMEANARLAETNLARNRKQMTVQAISQAELDSSIAALAVAKASLNEQKALIDKKHIRAPFAGKLGIRAVDIGQFVNAGTPIVTLQNLESIYVDFTVPQQEAPSLKAGQKVVLTTDTFPGRSFEGEVSTVNPKVEMNTRNVYVRATLTNADHALLPGMFANTQITVSEPRRLITVPQTAITYNPYGTTVYVVDEKKEEGAEKATLTARQVFVKTGETRGDQVAILDGLKEGDAVVVAGQLKIRNGALLEINNEKLPSNDNNPQPEDK